ncbi:MAG: DUF4838 domain-containing protein [Clostridia bacterium]|nr:DUF4838 domain-containing protein [Clostridia bacterium]
MSIDNIKDIDNGEEKIMPEEEVNLEKDSSLPEDNQEISSAEQAFDEDYPTKEDEKPIEDGDLKTPSEENKEPAKDKKNKKKRKKLIIIIAVALCLISAAAGLLIWLLQPKEPEPNVSAVPDVEIHEVAGTLHKVNVSEGSTPFVTNGVSEYKIYVDLSNPALSQAINKSAVFVKEQIYNATGAELEIESSIDGLTSSSRAIVYGFRNQFQDLGLSMPTDDIATSGYYIKTKGSVVFIEANGGDGYRMGGLAFLREVLGYNMISEDCIVYSKDAKTMPNMDIVERPDFDYRQISNYYSSIESYGMGMHTHSDIWIPINGWDMHNSLYYIPPELYKDAHPDWYRSDFAQPCYTAHGNKAEYDLLVETVFQVVKTRMQECPTLENISFTAMDGTGQDSCWCDSCLLYKELYGTPAAACIYFMNDLNKLVQDYIDQNEPGRVMNLVFFAYHDSEPAPVERNKYTDSNGKVIWADPIKDGNGNYMPLKKYARGEDGKFLTDSNGNYVYERDENGNFVYLTCDDHVYPWLAPIYSKFTSSFYDEENKSYAENVALWYTVSSNVYLWIYGTNFKYYLYPYNNWSCMVETYRYLKECGVKYVWDQGQERNQSTSFTDLKDYIDSKALFNVNVDYNQVIDDYFNYYYLEASEPMRNMFELIQARSAYLEENIPTISGGIYDDIGNAEYWPRVLLEEMLTMINEAYSAIEKYKTADPELYESLVKRIKKESIFPRYVICMYYGEYYANIHEMRASFRDDWNELGFSVYKETNGDMQSVFSNEWGL